MVILYLIVLLTVDTSISYDMTVSPSFIHDFTPSFSRIPGHSSMFSICQFVKGLLYKKVYFNTKLKPRPLEGPLYVV